MISSWNRVRWLMLSLVLLLALAVTAYAAVELEYFSGAWNDATVVLVWGTGSETDTAGFHVWRSESDLPIVEGQIDTSQATRVTSDPIVNPDGICNPQSGYDYTFTDVTVDEEQMVYYYYLESLNCSVGSEFYGEGESGLAVEQSDGKLFLPLVVTEP